MFTTLNKKTLYSEFREVSEAPISATLKYWTVIINRASGGHKLVYFRAGVGL